MSLRTRLILSFTLIVGIGFYYLTNWILNELRPRYLESAEETLVDYSQLLAAIVETHIQKGEFTFTHLTDAFEKTYKRPLSAQIYDLTKKEIDLRVYVTNASGIVIFDSKNKDVGKDYSLWNNIYLTLKGRYGVRTTHENFPQDDIVIEDPSKTSRYRARTVPQNPSKTDSVLHVSAPIWHQNKMIGVLTVAKPTSNINRFIESAKPQFIVSAVVAALSITLLVMLFSMGMTLPLKRLRNYALAIRDGKKVALPSLGKSEIAELGEAFEQMRKALEGKEYIENYIQTLTHEIKSPLAAIRGSAELLQESMPQEERHKFLSHITNESGRIQNLVDRMLKLSSLEATSSLKKRDPLSVSELLDKCLERLKPLLEKNKITVSRHGSQPALMAGDAFLVEQAMMNVLSNAIDFSPTGGCIEVELKQRDNIIELKISDRGPGIPDYAMNRIFEKFYSLPRPQTGQRSTGLGLAFVREVMRLHDGEISVENRPPNGTQVVLQFQTMK